MFSSFRGLSAAVVLLLCILLTSATHQAQQIKLDKVTVLAGADSIAAQLLCTEVNARTAAKWKTAASLNTSGDVVILRRYNQSSTLPVDFSAKTTLPLKPESFRIISSVG